MKWHNMSGTYWTDVGGAFGEYNIDATADEGCTPICWHIVGPDLVVPPDKPFVITKDHDKEFILFCATLEEAKATVLLLM